MNGNAVFEMLSRMTEEERAKSTFIFMNNNSTIDEVIIDVSNYLASEIEPLDFTHAREVGIHLDAKEINKEAEEECLERNHYLDDLLAEHYDVLYGIIKDKMIEDLRKIGYNIPDQI